MPKAKKSKTGRTRFPLLASAKLPDRKVKQVILAYCHHVPVRDAMAQTGLSHVTIYRIYGYIRRRLLDLTIYPTMEAFYREINIREEEGGPMFPDTIFFDAIDRDVGAHRGVKPENRPLYVAEKIYGRDNPYYAPPQLYRLILISAKHDGPLNRPFPGFVSPEFYAECARILAAQIEHGYDRLDDLYPDPEEPAGELGFMDAIAKETAMLKRKARRPRGLAGRARKRNRRTPGED